MDAIQKAFSAEAIANLPEAIYIMLKGMFGIFAFMVIFYGFIKLIEYMFREKEIDKKVD